MESGFYVNTELPQSTETFWSKKEKNALIFAACVALTLLIVYCFSLLVYMIKQSINAKKSYHVDVNNIKPNILPNMYTMGWNDAMNDKARQSSSPSYNKGYDEFMAYWDANHIQRESGMMTTGIIAALKGNPDESSSLVVRDKTPYIEGYNKTNEEILQVALSGGLNNVSYDSVSAGTGVFTVYIGDVFKNEYTRGYNVAKNITVNISISYKFPPRVIEIMKMAYDKGFSDGTTQ